MSKIITIGLSKHKGFAPVSKLIMYCLNRNFSHTYFKFKEEMYTDHSVFHAVGKGLNYISYTNFCNLNEVVNEFDVKISDELYNELLIDCHNNAGKKYGYLQNIGILIIRKINSLFKTKINKNPFDDGINCSEWVAYILQEIDPNWTDKDYNLVGPDDIYDYLFQEFNKDYN